MGVCGGWGQRRRTSEGEAREDVSVVPDGTSEVTSAALMYHHSNDHTVPKRAPSYHKNVDGPFYASDQCIICALPIETAPDNFGWDCPAECSDCPDSCHIKKQPENDAELSSMLEVMRCSEVENIRYCGTDPEVLRRLQEAGFARLCDALDETETGPR